MDGFAAIANRPYGQTKGQTGATVSLPDEGSITIAGHTAAQVKVLIPGLTAS